MKLSSFAAAGRRAGWLLMVMAFITVTVPALAHTPAPQLIEEIELPPTEIELPATEIDPVAPRAIELPPTEIDPVALLSEPVTLYDGPTSFTVFTTSEKQAFRPRCASSSGEALCHLIRNRWYDPHTGTFLSPDPLGYNDSSNLYAFCAGDPVNCSDPTGLAASMGRSGWIVATDNRNGSGIRRFSPAEIAADPQKVRAFLGLNADVDPREADAMIERAGAAWATGGDKMRVIAPGAAKAAGVYPLMAATAGAGIGGGIGAVASAELGLGFVGSTMLPGFTGGVGSQAGTDIQSGHFSGARQYAVSGSVGAVGSLAVGTVFGVGQRMLGLGTPDIIPSIAPASGWRPTLSLPADIAATFENGKFTARVLTEDLIVYRGEGQPFGRWFGATNPGSAAEAEHLYNVAQYGNDLTTVSAYRIPAKTIVWQGRVAGGSGWQYYVPDPPAAGVVQVGGPQPLPQFGH